MGPPHPAVSLMSARTVGSFARTSHCRNSKRRLLRMPRNFGDGVRSFHVGADRMAVTDREVRDELDRDALGEFS